MPIRRYDWSANGSRRGTDRSSGSKVWTMTIQNLRKVEVRWGRYGLFKDAGLRRPEIYSLRTLRNGSHFDLYFRTDCPWRVDKLTPFVVNSKYFEYVMTGLDGGGSRNIGSSIQIIGFLACCHHNISSTNISKTFAAFENNRQKWSKQEFCWCFSSWLWRVPKWFFPNHGAARFLRMGL